MILYVWGQRHLVTGSCHLRCNSAGCAAQRGSCFFDLSVLPLRLASHVGLEVDTWHFHRHTPPPLAQANGTKMDASLEIWISTHIASHGLLESLSEHRRIAAPHRSPPNSGTQSRFHCIYSRSTAPQSVVGLNRMWASLSSLSD